MDTYDNTVPQRNKRGSRTGYTTGSNAAAAAKAATIALLNRQWPAQVVITLPIGETATMAPADTSLSDEAAFCCMVKDAGDDPDVTHGALICATVRRTTTPGITLEGGKGVGRVTLPGLGLEVGGPAINPVPRRQIQENVTDAIRECGLDAESFLAQAGLEIVLSVPDGERLAQKTLNARLGIIGGISILGTTGKVFPYSTAAWRASVIQAVEVAAHNSVARIVLATGGRSERYAMELFPDLPETAFVEMSIFTGDALKTCIDHKVRSVAIVGMIGKLIKTAQGHMTTHVAGNQVDFQFLAEVCRATNAPEELVTAVEGANTGRHFLELCQAGRVMAPVQRVVDLALEQCAAFVRREGGALELEVVLVDFEGAALARAASTVSAPSSSEDYTAPPPLVQRLAADPSASYDDEVSLEG